MADFSKYSGEELVALLKAGDEGAFNQVYQQYKRPLCYFAWQMIRNRESAEEVTADSFVKLWSAREHMKTADGVKAFLYITTKNACLDYQKSRKNRTHFDYDAAETLLSNEPDSYARMVEAELLQSVYIDIDKLPAKQAAIFRMIWFDGLGTEEIAERIGISSNAVLIHKSRAVKALRLAFKKQNLLWGLYLSFLFISH